MENDNKKYYQNLNYFVIIIITVINKCFSVCLVFVQKVK